MKILARILLVVLALALACGLLGLLSLFVAIPWLSTFVLGLMARFSWLPLAFAVVLMFCLAAAVLAIVLLLSMPTKRKLFVVGRQAGNIEITRQSIESSAAASLEGIHEIKRYHVQAKGDLRPGKLKLNVQAEPRSADVNMDALGQVVQQQVAQGLAHSLAIEPGNVRVRFQPVHQPQTARHTAKVPRVV